MITIRLPGLTQALDRFPPVESALAEPDGLLAMGGDLSATRLIHAYRRGIFPWYDQDQPILWWSPDPRCVIFPDQMKISRSLKRSAKNRNYQYSFDTHFKDVVNACAAPRANATGTWITEDMKAAYQQLHHIGVAHSVEIWLDSSLVGGLYGLCLGPFFFGESMFSQARDASKIALLCLIQRLLPEGLTLIDCQVENPHLISLGATLISRTVFTKQLEQAYTPTQNSASNKLTDSIWPCASSAKTPCANIYL